MFVRYRKKKNEVSRRLYVAPVNSTCPLCSRCFISGTPGDDLPKCTWAGQHFIKATHLIEFALGRQHITWKEDFFFLFVLHDKSADRILHLSGAWCSALASCDLSQPRLKKNKQELRAKLTSCHSNSVNLPQPQHFHFMSSLCRPDVFNHFVPSAEVVDPPGAFLIGLACKFLYITWFYCCLHFYLNITSRAVFFLNDMTVFCILWPLEGENTAEGGRRTIFDATVSTVGFEENLYWTCCSCIQPCSLLTSLTFYPERKRTRKLLILSPSAFHTWSRRLEFFHFLFFCALVSMYGKCYKKKNYCDGINST